MIPDDTCREEEIADTSPFEATMDPPRSVTPPELPLVPYTGSQGEAREKFIALSTCLLGDNGIPNDFRQAAYDLYALFNEIGGRPQDVIGGAAFTWQQETLLPTGKAINPHTAATCLLDYARTRAFARGVHEAIEAAQKRFAGERIEILYAGTGPFAPLALMQTPFFGPDEVRFTLIDMHQPALSCQARIISVLGLEGYVEETVQTDATEWIPPDGKKYHIAVAEVMQRALIVEPQVGVTMAVTKHLRPGGLLVPERVELTLCLLKPGAEQYQAEAGVARMPQYFRLSGDSIPGAKASLPDTDPTTGGERVIIATPFTLTGSIAVEHEITDAGQIRLPSIRFPDRIFPGQELRILTRITTSGGIVLSDYDSALTFPEGISDEPLLTPGGLYEVWYEVRGNPGLRLRAALSG